MCIIDSFHKHFLVLPWVYTPSSPDNSHVTFCNSVSCNFEGSQSVLNLTYWVKLIHLGTLNCWLSSNIAFWKSFISRAIHALSWTSPELCQKRNDRNPGKGTYSSFSKDFPDSRVIYIGLVRNSLSIKFKYLNRAHIFDFIPIFRKKGIFYFLIIPLTHKRSVAQ